MPKMPRFENTWTVGNMLTLIAMCVGGFAVYADARSELRVLNQIVLEYRADVVDLRGNVTQNETRIRALELGVGRIEEKLLSIGATAQRIEQALTSQGARP